MDSELLLAVVVTEELMDQEHNKQIEEHINEEQKLLQILLDSLQKGDHEICFKTENIHKLSAYVEILSHMKLSEEQLQFWTLFFNLLSATLVSSYSLDSPVINKKLATEVSRPIIDFMVSLLHYENFTDSILNNIVSILELLCIPNTTISNEELKLRKRDLKLTPPVCEMLIKLKPVAEPSGMHNVIQQLMTLEPQQGIKMSSCSLMQQDNLTYFTKLSGTTYLLNLSKVSRGTTLVRILQFVQLAPDMKSFPAAVELISTLFSMYHNEQHSVSTLEGHHWGKIPHFTYSKCIQLVLSYILRLSPPHLNYYHANCIALTLRKAWDSFHSHNNQNIEDFVITNTGLVEASLKYWKTNDINMYLMFFDYFQRLLGSEVVPSTSTPSKKEAEFYQQYHSGQELLDWVFAQVEPKLILDELFLVLMASYVKCVHLQSTKQLIPSPPPPPPTNVPSPQPEQDDLESIRNLFEGSTVADTTPVHTETENSTEFISFLCKLIQCITALMSNNRIFMPKLTVSHVNVLLGICYYQSPFTPTQLLKDNSVRIEDVNFTNDFHGLLFKMVTGNCFTDELQLHIYSKVGFTGADLPTFIPLEQLRLVTWIILNSQQSNQDQWPQKIWNHVMTYLNAALVDQTVTAAADTISREYVTLLLFLFHLLPVASRTNVVKSLVSILVSDTKRVSLRSQMIMARFILVLDYVLKFYDSPAPFVLAHIRTFLSSTVSSLHHKSLFLVSHYSQLFAMDSAILEEKYYLLDSLQHKGQAFSQAVQSTLGNYDTFYDRVCAMLNIPLTDEPMSTQAFLQNEYFFLVVWNFLNSLPQPSKIASVVQTGASIKTHFHDNSLLVYFRSLYEMMKSSPSSLDDNLSNHVQVCVSSLTDVAQNASQGMRKEAIINSILMILRTVITPGQEGKQKSKTGATFSDAIKSVLSELSLQNKLVQAVESLLVQYSTLAHKQIQSQLVADSPLPLASLTEVLIQSPIDFTVVRTALEQLGLKLLSSTAFGKTRPKFPQFDEMDTVTTYVFVHNPYRVDSLVPSYLLCYAALTHVRCMSTLDVLFSLVLFTELFVNTCSKLQPPISSSTLQGLLAPLLGITQDCSLEFLKVDCQKTSELLADKELIAEYTGRVKLAKYQAILDVLLSHRLSLNELSPVITEILACIESWCKDKKKQTCLLNYFCRKPSDWHSPLPLGKPSTLFKLLAVTDIQNNMVEKLLLLLCAILEPTDNKEFYSELRSTLLAEVAALEPSLFGAVMVLGVTSSESIVAVNLFHTNQRIRSSLSKLLELCCTHNTSIHSRLMDALLHFVRPDLLTKPDIKEYFSLLKQLAAKQDQLPKLLSSVHDVLRAVSLPTLCPESFLTTVTFIYSCCKSCSVTVPSVPKTPVDKISSSLFTLDTDESEDQTQAREALDIDLPLRSNAEERQLASKLCTYTTTSNTFTEQHWYYCYTCNLTQSEGCCSICVQVCHRGHEVSYSRYSRFFCDCGHRGGCKALKKRKVLLHSEECSAHEEEQPGEMDTTINEDAKKQLWKLFADEQIYRSLLSLHAQLSNSLLFESQLAAPVKSSTDPFEFKGGYKSGSIPETRLKMDGSNDVKCFRSALSVHSSGKVAVGSVDTVLFLDISSLFDASVASGSNTLDKSAYKIVSQAVVGFEIVSVQFNREFDGYLLVTGLKNCRILTLHANSWEVVEQLEINMSLEAISNTLYIKQALWIPGSLVQAAVVTDQFISVYDLSKDNIAPAHYITLQEGTVNQIAFLPTSNNQITLIAASSKNILYLHGLNEGNGGPIQLTKTLRLPSSLEQVKSIASLYYSPVLRSLFISYSDGTCVGGIVDLTTTQYTVTFTVSAAPVLWWRELHDSPCRFVCATSDALVCMKDQLVACQSLKAAGKASHVDGVEMMQRSLLVLWSDGSLSRYDARDSLGVNNYIHLTEFHKTTTAPTPAAVTFFETAQNITSSVTLAGDVLQQYTSDVAKQRLASAEEYLMSPSASGFKLIVQNGNNDMVMVGVRVLLGSSKASLQHTPQHIKLFDRLIDVVQGVRRWYDIPFTQEETLASDKEFTLHLSACANGNEPILDSMEVYAKPKDEYAWKEKQAQKKKSEQVRHSSALQVAHSTILHCMALLSKDNFPRDSSDSLVQSISSILTAYSAAAMNVRPLAKSLLLSLLGNQIAYHTLKDNVTLSYIDKHSSADLPVPLFARFVRDTQQIASHRPRNFTIFIKQHQEFIPKMLHTFWSLYVGILDKEHLYPVLSGLMEILYIVGLATQQEDQPAHQFALSVMWELLSNSRDAVRSYAAKKMCGLIALSKTFGSSVTGQMTTVSAAQYYCDHCHLFIQDVRWSCDVCKDFDLCAKCHDEKVEVQPSSDHLPAHSMTKQAMELRPTTKDELGSLLPTSVHPSDEEGLLHLAVQLSLSNTAPPSLPTRSFQDHREAFHVELLGYLFTKCIAFHESGSATIPSMKVVYFLLCYGTAGTSPNLELVDKFCAMFFQQTKQLSATPHTPQLESQLLWLIMMTAVLNDSTLSASKPVAAALHEKKLLNFVYDHLSSLLASLSSESPKKSGISMLSPSPWSQRINIGLMPFFSSNYMKQHPQDLFEQCDHLLAEALLQIAVGIQKQMGMEFSGLLTPDTVPKWKELLCSYVCSPHTLFLKQYSKVLLRSLCADNKQEYHLVVDKYSLQKQSHTLLASFTSRGTDISYQERVQLVEILSTLVTVASARPASWKQYCIQDTAIVSFLYEKGFYFPEEASLLTIKLLAVLFQTDKTEQATGLSSQVSVLMSDQKALFKFVNMFLLEVNSSEIRSSVQALLTGMWSYSSLEQQEVLFRLLLSLVPTLPSFGRNSSEFCQLLSLVGSLPKEKSQLVQALVAAIVENVKAENLLLSHHPNSHIYNSLSHLVEFDGYYLEGEPCLVCNNPELPWSRSTKLDALKAETKFTHNTQVIKFHSSYMIQNITLHISDIKKLKMVQTINFYSNNKLGTDLVELKNKWSAWSKIKSCNLEPAQTDLNVQFPLPIVASNLLIEYASFYDNLNTSEKLQCPRCNRVVTDKHGVCPRCRENAYQCRQCRTINYENPQAFLCIECGYCKYARFDLSMTVKPSLTTEKMETEADKAKGIAAIDKELDVAHSKYQQLASFKKPISKILSSIYQQEDLPAAADLLVSSTKVNRKIAVLASLYAKECKTTFDQLSKSLQTLQSLRRELHRFTKTTSSPQVQAARVHNRCYGCATAFLSQALSLLYGITQHNQLAPLLSDLSPSIVTELVKCNIHHGTSVVRADARKLICALTADNREATRQLNTTLQEKLRYLIANYQSLDVGSFISDDMNLLADCMKIQDSFWEDRMKMLLGILFQSIEVAAECPTVCEFIISPCLKIVADLCKVDIENKDVVLLSPALEPTVTYSDWNTQRTNYQQWKTRYEGTLLSAGGTTVGKRERFLAIKYATRWKKFVAARKSAHSAATALINPLWLKKMIISPSHTIRAATVSLINSFCSVSESRSFYFLDLLTNEIIEYVIPYGEQATEFFSLLKGMVQPEHSKLYLTAKGFLKHLCNFIEAESAKMKQTEMFSQVTDLTQGYTLKVLVEMLVSFLEVDTIRLKFKKDNLLDRILETSLLLRGLTQKSKIGDDSCKLLIALLAKLHSESEEDNKNFISACIRALKKQEQAADVKAPLFIYEQLCNIICPTKPEAVYSMVLKKSPTQEDFIRGHMNNNPYSSANIGKTMRDVKNKICTTLDLHALTEDDNSMELLVYNKIIKLDLTIAQVYNHVWKKAMTQADGSTPPMIVTYRLQGLDGEATEEMVGSLPSENEEEKDPEEVYRISSVMSTCGGLEAVLQSVVNLTNFEQDSEFIHKSLTLLYYCCKLKVNRQALLGLDAINCLLPKLQLAFAAGTHSNLAELLLLIIESLVLEANMTKGRAGITSSVDVETGVAQMKMIVDKLPLVKSNPKIVKTVSRILPHLTYGKRAIINAFIEYFLPYLDMEKYDKEPTDELQTLHLECFADVCESIRIDEHGALFKACVAEKGITRSLLSYIAEHFNTTTTNWQDALSKASLPFVLRQLAGLAKSHLPTQRQILDLNLIPVLHKLEKTTAVKTIGNLAENLLEVLRDTTDSEDTSIKSAVDMIRNETKTRLSEQAEKYREKILKEMQLSTGSGKVTVKAVPNVIEELEEETGLKCMVCMEGYHIRPQDVLGIYTFSIRRPLIEGTKHKQEYGLTTVTHFSVIHFACHREATKAERLLKPPKEEWEGATIRNQHTKCNNLFPILGSKVPIDAYLQCVEKYWSNLYNITARNDPPRFRLHVHDLKFLLLYFAREESLSVHSQGGGRESNIKLIPFMIQQGVHLLDQKSTSTQRKFHERILAQFLLQQSSDSAGSPADNVLYMMTSSLLLQSLQEWRDCKKHYLKQLVRFVTTECETATVDLFKSLRPYMIFFCMVNKLQTLLCKSAAATWVSDMSTALSAESTRMVEDMTQLLRAYEDEYLQFQDLQEFFDELDLLKLVEHHTSPSDFVTSLIRE